MALPIWKWDARVGRGPQGQRSGHRRLPREAAEEGQDLAALARGHLALFSLPVSGPVGVLTGNPETVLKGLRGSGLGTQMWGVPCACPLLGRKKEPAPHAVSTGRLHLGVRSLYA